MGTAVRPVAARISAAVLSQLSSLRLATTTSAPRLRQPEAHRTTDAAAPPGDDGDASGEVEELGG